MTAAAGAMLLVGSMTAGPANATPSRVDPTWYQPWAASGLQSTLTANTALGATIGYSSALSADGSTAVLGAPDANNYGGAVFVYHRTGSTWQQEAELTQSDLQYAEIGFSVAVSGDGKTIVAGASNSGGRVYVFSKPQSQSQPQGSWKQSAEFAPPAGGGPFNELGYSVSISADGSTIAAGDWARYSDRGSVFVYGRTADGWSADSEVTAADGVSYDYFGYQTGVSLSGDGSELAVGAMGKDKDKGAVYVFARQDGAGASWSQTAELSASDGAASNRFGESVALAGTGQTLAVGSPYHDKGVGYVFGKAGSSWTQTSELQATGERDYPPDAYAVSTSFDGSVVGLGLESRNSLYGAGAVFVRSGFSGYRQAATLVPSESVGTTAGAGSSIAISADGHTAVLGAPTVAEGTFPAGAGFVFRDIGVDPVLNAATVPSTATPPSAAASKPATASASAPKSLATSQPHISHLAGNHPILNSEHRTASVCPAPAAGFASCDAQVVTDDALNPLDGSTYTDGLTPAQLQSAYNLKGATGSELIAVVDAYANPDAQTSLNTYRKQFGLGPIHLTQVNEKGGAQLPPGNINWGTEEMLDLEMISAACPTCSILYVGADSASFDDLGTAVNTAVSLGAKVVSNSYGGGESADELPLQAEYYQHPGVVITASSGDFGYGVSAPAAFSSVVAVGGTSLTLTASGARASETVWDGAGSGCSRFVAKPQWQHDSYCAKRTVTDVSAVADPDTGVAVYDLDDGGWIVEGGTSVAAPLIAGVYGVAGHAGRTPGNPAERLYSAPAHSLFDVTSGVNGTCSKAYLCSGSPGYDGPTGVGSPNGVGAF